jgi:hypothetical protein
MSEKKTTVKNLGGRPKGVPNRVTMQAREAIAQFVDGNAHRLQEWLNKVADGVQDAGGNYVVKPDPDRAFTLFQSVVEYHVPKLARTEVTGVNGGPVEVKSITRRIVDPGNGS